MASANMKKICAKCSKGGGTAMCYGCEQAFCTKHFIEHRQELSQQMDNVGQEHDVLRRDLIQEQSIRPLIAHIDQWEQESITKIQTVAKLARANLQESLTQAKNQLQSSVSKMTEELQSSRESDDYTEIDIKKWMEQLKGIRKLLNSPPTVNIDYDNDTRSIIRLIKVNDPQTSRLYENNDRTSQKLITSTLERFDKFIGDIILSEDGLTAKCLEGRSVKSGISGIGRYTLGIHHIRFQIEQIIDRFYFFFGIITLSQETTKYVYKSPSANGWWDLDYTVMSGNEQSRGVNKIIRTGDEVTLLLDCDNRLIQLEHHRTNKVVQLPIDLQHCPFPWKLVVVLQPKDACLRILH